jgi:hypothetical protein
MSNTVWVIGDFFFFVLNLFLAIFGYYRSQRIISAVCAIVCLVVGILILTK